MNSKPKTSVPEREEARMLAVENGHTMGAWLPEKAVTPLGRDEDVAISRCATEGCQLTIMAVRTRAGQRVRIGRLRTGLACPTHYLWPVYAKASTRLSAKAYTREEQTLIDPR